MLPAAVLLAQLSFPGNVTCSLTSSNTICKFQLLEAWNNSIHAMCSIDVGGTWTGQLDWVVVGLETPAPAGVAKSSDYSNGNSTNTNGLWTIKVDNIQEFRVVVDVPGSFTGTANVGIQCSGD